MTQDDEHLRLLAIFHYVVAALAALFSLFPVLHVVMGILMLAAPEKMGGGNNPPPFMGWFFIVVGCGFILAGMAFGACIAVAGRFLQQRRRYLFCLVMAGVECLFMPFGTVLGIFTILVLSRPSVKALFSPPVP